MNNKKAQALVEFVLILPILIMILFSIIDFGNIFVTKSNLENKINDAYQVLKESTEAEFPFRKSLCVFRFCKFIGKNRVLNLN